MLHLSTIEPQTLELLREISAMDVFKDVRLVGGTSLALQIGHRKSVDLDFFGQINFNTEAFQKAIYSFNQVEVLVNSPNIKTYTINHIKVDFVNYSYPWLADFLTYENIKLAQPKDIAAMKIAAITGRGSRKDFVDLYFLLKLFSLEELFHFYLQKYHDASEYLALKSLTYFDDAELDADPFMIQKADWKSIKQKIREEVIGYSKR